MRVFRLIAAIGVLLAPGLVNAQDGVATDPPAHVSFVEGSAALERDGTIDNAPANMPLLAGDRLRTESGRVEVLFADGSTLHLDNFTTVDFQSDELVRVLDGRVRLMIAGRTRQVAYRLDAPMAWAQIAQPGEYRLALTRRDTDVEVELAVLRGSAELVNDSGRTELRAGERAFARAGAAPSYPYIYNSASWDAFDRWSEERRDYRLGLSSQYLPEDVRPYTRAFDTYGTWRHEATYGYVWYPTVTVGWRPYHYGRWARLRPWGWTWVGHDPWAWPTHHYGRWGFARGQWFWVPGHRWGPAWVSWAYAPGYVSWCPLGWNDRPVFSIGVSVHTGYDPWRAWTVVPRSHFGVGFVHRRVVTGRALDVRVRNAFVMRDAAPASRGYAVPRSAAPIRVAGSRTLGTAVPRGSVSSSPVYTNLDPDDARVRSRSRRIQVDSPDSGRSRSAVPRAGGVRSPDAGDTSQSRTERSVGPTAVPRNRAGTPGAAPAAPNDERDDDERSRARGVRRVPDGYAPRMIPDRGVRAVPRTPVGPAESAAPAGPDSSRESPGYRRRAPARVPGESRGYGDAPVYRPSPPAEAPEAGRRPQAMPAPVIRATPRERTDGWGSSSRAPERRAPESGPPPGAGVVPRVPGPPPAHSGPPPRIERRAPPPRAAEAPSSGAAPPPQSESRSGSGRSGAVRRPPGG